MSIDPISPSSMHSNPAFAQAMLVSHQGKTLYIGGQNGITAEGTVISSDFGEQTEQALRNVLTILKSVDADQRNVVKLTIYIADGQDINQGFAAAQKVWGQYATAITVVKVAGLGLPNALVEIDAIAVIEA